MKNHLKNFSDNFKTKTNSTFIKKQILNASLFHLISLFSLLCAITLLIIGSVKDSSLYEGFGLFFLVVFFVLLCCSWSLIFLLNQNAFFVKRLIGSKFNYLFFAFWLGFSFSDKLTEYELTHNYDFSKENSQIIVPTKTKKAVPTKNTTELLIGEENHGTEMIATTIIDAKEQSPVLTGNFKDEIALRSDNISQKQEELQDKLKQYQEMLLKKEELESQLASLQSQVNSTFDAELELQRTAALEKIKTEILEQSTIIIDFEKDVDSLISEIDLSSKTKMIRKKDELEKLLAYYQNKQKNQ